MTNIIGTAPDQVSLNGFLSPLAFQNYVAVDQGGTGITSLGAGVSTALGQNVTGSGGIVLSSGGALTGVTLNDGYTEEVYALSGTTPALSPANGSIQTWALPGSSVPTIGTWDSGQNITLVVNDGADYSITWPTISWKTDAGSAPTLNTTTETVIQLWKVGSTIFGARVGDA